MCVCVCPSRRAGGVGESVSYLFEGHPLVVQHLVPALLNLYTGGWCMGGKGGLGVCFWGGGCSQEQKLRFVHLLFNKRGKARLLFLQTHLPDCLTGQDCCCRLAS